MNVLLLEDDDAFAESLRDALHDFGMKVSRARTVVEARRQLASTRIDVALVDLGLADERGRHLLDDIAELPGTPPMIVLSGQPNALQVAKEFGIACVTKPSTLAEVVAAIRSAVDHDVRPVTARSISGMRPRIDEETMARMQMVIEEKSTEKTGKNE